MTGSSSRIHSSLIRIYDQTPVAAVQNQLGAVLQIEHFFASPDYGGQPQSEGNDRRVRGRTTHRGAKTQDTLAVQ